ncbi:hypothetical protein MiHa_02044 [Microcystis aeruginosa NIES-2522]|uniref:hypothetical protein n=1 Tax=Microcystis aeruginosa TaxID=1126 RepID=UPI001230FFB2|nr:hypothetical protein [Microcystis aeruginosa]GCA84075.1 hypothetical protein MiHa_02044 [Microcystis aeruginosa NIES-2522]
MTSDSKNETGEVNNPKDPSASLALPTESNSVRHNLKKNPKPYRLDEVSEFDKPDTDISPPEQRRNFNTRVAGFLATWLWIGLLFTAFSQIVSIFFISFASLGIFNLNINLKAIKEQEVQSRVDKAATLINDSSKTIYTFLGPIATAVTAFYFSGLGSSSKTNDENSENERNE